MTSMDAVKTVSECLDSGAVLTVLADGKLSMKGNKAAPVMVTLKGMVQTDRQSVLTAIKTVNMQRAAMAGWNTDKVAPQADVAVSSAVITDSIDPAPTPNLVKTSMLADDLNARTVDLRLFVGRVVSNDQMYILMRRSNRGPVKVWGEWYNSIAWPCDHWILGWWEEVSA